MKRRMKSKSKMYKLDPNVCLPPELLVDKADDKLYRIGLCPNSVREQPKRHPINHPLCAFIVVSLFLVERLTTCALPHESIYFYSMMGSMGYLWGVGQHLDSCFILVTILSLSTQAIYWWNDKKGIEPTFLRLFQMLSGSVAPIKLGITDQRLIFRMTKTYNNWYAIIGLNVDYVISILPSSCLILTYAWRTDWRQTILLGIPNTILFGLWAHYFWNIFLYQFLMFIIICSYLKHKIMQLNQMAKEMRCKNEFSRIQNILRSYHSVIVEIDEYNTTYWSKFLFVFWLTYGTNAILMIYITFIAPIEPLFSFLAFYPTFGFCLSFVMLIFTASSVNYCANNSYKIFTSLILCDSRNKNNFSKIRLNDKFKVFSKYHLLNL